eukprot:GEZU01010512.1.p2 GENE.GEZU01010512.1~~GEZU01010512.1.p2  ORF type:complete len:140 (-),score=22.32 GEZU01010512.1:234-653(-)
MKIVAIDTGTEIEIGEAGAENEAAIAIAMMIEGETETEMKVEIGNVGGAEAEAEAHPAEGLHGMTTDIMIVEIAEESEADMRTATARNAESGRRKIVTDGLQMVATVVATEMLNNNNVGVVMRRACRSKKPTRCVPRLA